MTFPHRWAKLDDKYYPDPNSGCWIWLERCNESGYAYVSYRGKNQRAHRLFFERAKGAIPKGLTLDHKCRVRCCVNPNHLEPVTQTENRRRGVRHQLADQVVDYIRAVPLWNGRGRQSASSGLETVKGLSQKLSVPRTTIQRIRSGQEWRGSAP